MATEVGDRARTKPDVRREMDDVGSSQNGETPGRENSAAIRCGLHFAGEVAIGITARTTLRFTSSVMPKVPFGIGLQVSVRIGGRVALPMQAQINSEIAVRLARRVAVRIARKTGSGVPPGTTPRTVPGTVPRATRDTAALARPKTPNSSYCRHLGYPQPSAPPN
jgi:hypothetical protein